MRRVFRLAGWILFTGALAGEAAPISVQDVYHFRDVRSANNLGLAPGDWLTYGGYFTPNPSGGDPGTTIVAQQGNVTRNVFYLQSPASPDEFLGGTAYMPSLTGAWTLTVTNPASPNSPLVVQTQSVRRPDGSPATPPGFVRDMTLSGTGADLLLSFQAPPGSTHDTIRVRIFDRNTLVNNSPQMIHASATLPATATSYAIPDILNAAGDRILPAGRYVVSVELDERRSDGSLLAKSRSIFEFTPTDGSVPNVHLPTVGPDGVYTFDATVVAGQTIFIDPFVAIGYDYMIGAGDPNFASVLLPMVGDGLFDLYLFDGQDYVFAYELAAGTTFFFGGEGIDRFRILGIEADAGLDPADVTAFVTGLTFVADGRFTGSMTPITQFVPEAVPEPGTLILVGSGVLGLALARRRRQSADA